MLLALWSADPLAAQLQAAPRRADPDLPQLLDLGGSPLAVVRYTPGSLERAWRVQRRLVTFSAEVTTLLNDRTPFLAYLLTREEWEAAGFQRPFGMPELTAGGALALPAVADAESVRLWRGLLAGALPAPSSHQMMASPQEVGALTAAEVLGWVEIGRLVVERNPAAVDTPWLSEVLAHLVARVPFIRNHQDDLAAIDSVFVGMVMAGGGDGARPLAAWRPDLPIAEQLWFQGQFGRGAAALIADRGFFPTRRLMEGALRKRKPLTAASVLERGPALAGWLQVGFAAP
jgi:hypothetical protein